MEITVYTDGASRNNPGESASGFIIQDKNGEYIECFYNGIKTNNEAEYLAVIAAMKKLKERKNIYDIITIFSDSELMIKQLQGNYKVKTPSIMVLYEEALSLFKEFSSLHFKNLPRSNKNITKVDYALNKLLDEREHNKNNI